MFDDEVPQQSSEMPPSAMAGGRPVVPPDEDEVPDIFDGSNLGGPPPGEHMADASPETTLLGPSALESGKLQRMQQPADRPMGMGATATQQTADLHEPTAIKRIMLAAIVLVVVALIGFGVWFYVIRQAATSVTPTAQPVITTTPDATPDTTAPVTTDDGKSGVNVDATEPILQPVPEPTPAPVKPDAVPLPTVDSQKDSDKDGLTDDQELKLGTDAANPDTDGDGLNDSAEINIWGTDPLVKDTDDDGFTDGQEVLNGFNPKGSGKAH